MVSESSACLFWPDDVETRIPIDANHSMIGKLSNGIIDSKYHNIRQSIADIARDAVLHVRCRFLLPEVYEALKKTCSLLKFIQGRATKLEGRCHELLIGISRRAEAIHSTLTHHTLGVAILGAQSGLQVVTPFAEKTFQLLRLLSPYDVVARERDPMYLLASGTNRLPANLHQSAYHYSEKSVDALFHSDNIIAILSQAGDIMQAQVQMLSISMLRDPVDQSMLESHSPSKQAGLHRIAAMQAMFGTEYEGFQSSLQGSLSILSEGSKNGIDGLITGHYSEGDEKTKKLVLVAYKTYAKPRRQYLRGMSKEDEDQAAVTKDLAKKLASLLRKSSLETAVDVGQALHEFDATTSTFRCLGYKDDPENGRLAFLYEIPKSGVGPELTLSPKVKTLKQLIDGGLKISLERKFQLALKICSTILNLHCSGWVHKSIRSNNVVLIPKIEADAPDDSVSDYDIYLKGFEFSRMAVGKSNPFESSSNDDLYRHPDRQGLPDQRFTREYDLYAVGLVLLEIGTGRHLKGLLGTVQKYLRDHNRPENPQEYREGFRLLADVNTQYTMGTKYSQAVVKCLDGAVGGFGVHKDDSKHETDLALAFQQQVVWKIAPGTDL